MLQNINKLISKIITSPNFSKLNNISFHLTITIKNWNKISKKENIPKNLHTLYLYYNNISKKENIPEEVVTLL